MSLEMFVMLQAAMKAKSLLVEYSMLKWLSFFFFQAEDGIRDYKVTGVQTCALPILVLRHDLTTNSRPGKNRCVHCRHLTGRPTTQAATRSRTPRLLDHRN